MKDFSGQSLPQGDGATFYRLLSSPFRLIAQSRILVNANDTAQELAARVLIREQQIYPTVVSWFVSGRLSLQQDQAVMDGTALPREGLQIDS